MQTSHRGAAAADWMETAELETEVSERGRATGDASYISLISLSCSGLSIYPALHPYHLITVYFPDNHLCQQIGGRMSSRLSEEQLYITRISDS